VLPALSPFDERDYVGATRGMGGQARSATVKVIVQLQVWRFFQ
jgi:hypothetical protein